MELSMRFFATSDLHIDFSVNKNWFDEISSFDYIDDVLIIAGDITDIHNSIQFFFKTIRPKFKEIIFVPGNHDLWTFRNKSLDSLECFNTIQKITADNGIHTSYKIYGNVTIIPLLGWYDYSFGQPDIELQSIWGDFAACKWPENFREKEITDYFISHNEKFLNIKNEFIITFSHFMPRIDIMPAFIPLKKRLIYPVLGTTLLENQIRTIKPQIHVYGHSHVNLDVKVDKIRYINNAFGYPYETRIASKQLKKIHEI
jgi:Icc-related predicted phosphoesterase